MNEEVSGKQKDGDFIKDFEIFKKQYALVLLQLRDANDQVSFLLECFVKFLFFFFIYCPWVDVVFEFLDA